MASEPAGGRILETAVGLCASRGSRTVDAGAGTGDGVLVVADGMGGHCTGWLGARLAVHALLGPLAPTALVGAADGFPDDWGWAGAMQSRAAAEHIYDECVAALPAAHPRELAALFVEIDRVVATVPRRAHIHGLMVGCIAARIDGASVRGAHAGIGRALLLRAGAQQFASLVVEHYLHLVHDRMQPDPAPGLDPAEVPRDVICNGLGALGYSNVGVDEFAVELAAGDLLVLCSQRLDLGDAAVVSLVRAAVEADVPLDELARELERRCAAVFADEPHRATDVAFALALAR